MINILDKHLKNLFIWFYDFSIIIWYHNFRIHITWLVKMQTLSFSVIPCLLSLSNLPLFLISFLLRDWLPLCFYLIVHLKWSFHFFYSQIT